MNAVHALKLIIRKARLSDLPEIVNIYNQAVKTGLSTAEVRTQTASGKKIWFELHRNPRRPLFVFMRDNRVVAWLSFSDFYGRPAYRHTAEISVYVDEKYRNMGIGRHVLLHAVSLAPSLQINVLLGFIFHINKPSIRLFKSMGFNKWGSLEKVADMKGRWLDLLILGLQIKKNS